MSEQAEHKDNERWLSDGLCIECRRFKYCSKPCKAQKERKRAILEKLWLEARKRKANGDAEVQTADPGSAGDGEKGD